MSSSEMPSLVPNTMVGDHICMRDAQSRALSGVVLLHLVAQPAKGSPAFKSGIEDQSRWVDVAEETVCL